MLCRTAASVSSQAVATRAVMAFHTVSGISCAREGHHSVLGAAVRSSADVCRRCHAATTSNTLSARSVVSRCFAVHLGNFRVDLTATRVSHGLEDDEKSNRYF